MNVDARRICTTLHFLRPQWLWALLALPLLAWWWRARRRAAQRLARRGRSASAAAPARSGSDRRARAARLARRLLGFALAVCALAGPSWRQVAQPLWQSRTPLVIALDLSSATLAERPAAVAPAAGARQARDAAARARRWPGRPGRFADDAFTVAPLTDDAANVALFLDALAPDVMPVDGSAPIARSPGRRSCCARPASSAATSCCSPTTPTRPRATPRPRRARRVIACPRSGWARRGRGLSQSPTAGSRRRGWMRARCARSRSRWRPLCGAAPRRRRPARARRARSAAGAGRRLATQGETAALAGRGLLAAAAADAAGAVRVPPRRRGWRCWCCASCCRGAARRTPPKARGGNAPTSRRMQRLEQGGGVSQRRFRARGAAFDGSTGADAATTAATRWPRQGRYDAAIAAYDAGAAQQPGMADAIANSARWRPRGSASRRRASSRATRQDRKEAARSARRAARDSSGRSRQPPPDNPAAGRQPPQRTPSRDQPRRAHGATASAPKPASPPTPRRSAPPTPPSASACSRRLRRRARGSTAQDDKPAQAAPAKPPQQRERRMPTKPGAARAGRSGQPAARQVPAGIRTPATEEDDDARLSRLRWSCAVLAAAAVAAAPGAQAQTRAWLDRDQIALGETVTLNIETDAGAGAPDYAPLRGDFDLSGQTSSRQLESSNGAAARARCMPSRSPAARRRDRRFRRCRSAAAHPAADPAGDAGQRARRRAPATPCSSKPRSTTTPYVQQTVGWWCACSTPRRWSPASSTSTRPTAHRCSASAKTALHARGRRPPLQRGRAPLPADPRAQRHAGAFPARASTGAAPAASSMTCSATAAARCARRAAPRTLHVRATPATAPQPWLPLHGLRLRYPATPQHRVPAKRPPWWWRPSPRARRRRSCRSCSCRAGAGAQVFAEPAQFDETFDDGRPQATLTRRFSIVPARAGTLRIAGRRMAWWDVRAGAARTASLPDLSCRSRRASGSFAAPAAGADATTRCRRDDDGRIRVPGVQGACGPGRWRGGVRAAVADHPDVGAAAAPACPQVRRRQRRTARRRRARPRATSSARWTAATWAMSPMPCARWRCRPRADLERCSAAGRSGAARCDRCCCNVRAGAMAMASPRARHCARRSSTGRAGERRRRRRQTIAAAVPDRPHGTGRRARFAKLPRFSPDRRE